METDAKVLAIPTNSTDLFRNGNLKHVLVVYG